MLTVTGEISRQSCVCQQAVYGCTMGDQGVPTYVLVVDSVGLILAILGFCMAFRQKFVRKLFRQARHSTEAIPRPPPHEDQVRYAHLISGIMVMSTEETRVGKECVHQCRY